MRDSAAVLDLIAGEMPGDPYTAPPPARPFADEVGTDPGALRIGLRTRASGDIAATDDECVAAAEDAARLLESLGHHVEPAAPAAFDEVDLIGYFTTIMATGVVWEVEEAGRMLGRALTADDVERYTWAQYELGKTAGAIDYLRADQQRARMDPPDGVLVGGPRRGRATASTCCSRRRWPNRRCCWVRSTRTTRTRGRRSRARRRSSRTSRPST